MQTADFDTWAGINGQETVLGGRVGRNGLPVVVTKARQFGGLTWLSSDNLLMAGACLLLAGLAVAMGVVSWRAEYQFVYGTKHQPLASALEALGLDAGAVVFSVLGIALARMKRRAVIERSLVRLCALGSCGMNLLAADLGSPRSIAVYAMPPVLFAAGSDRLIAVIRRLALGQAEDDDGRSALRVAGLAFLYLLRLPLAPGARLAVHGVPCCWPRRCPRHQPGRRSPRLRRRRQRTGGRRRRAPPSRPGAAAAVRPRRRGSCAWSASTTATSPRSRWTGSRLSPCSGHPWSAWTPGPPAASCAPRCGPPRAVTRDDARR